MDILLVEDHIGYRERVAAILQKHFPGIDSLRTAKSFDEACIFFQLHLILVPLQVQFELFLATIAYLPFYYNFESIFD